MIMNLLYAKAADLLGKYLIWEEEGRGRDIIRIDTVGIDPDASARFKGDGKEYKVDYNNLSDFVDGKVCKIGSAKVYFKEEDSELLEEKEALKGKETTNEEAPLTTKEKELWKRRWWKMYLAYSSMGIMGVEDAIQETNSSIEGAMRGVKDFFKGK